MIQVLKDCLENLVNAVKYRRNDKNRNNCYRNEDTITASLVLTIKVVLFQELYISIVSTIKDIEESAYNRYRPNNGIKRRIQDHLNDHLSACTMLMHRIDQSA